MGSGLAGSEGGSRGSQGLPIKMDLGMGVRELLDDTQQDSLFSWNCPAGRE